MVAEPAAMQGPGKIISLDGRRRLMEDATEEKAKREPAVAIPLVYTQMLKGDARAAMFLAQVLFHQRSDKAADGWFWHTLEQWEDELGFSDDAESRCCKTLKGYGLQTKVKAVNHIPKKHYHVDEDALQEKVNEFRHFRESRKCEKQQKLVSVAKNSGYISTSGKAVNDDTSGFSVNGTSVEPVNGTSGKAEDLQGKEDIDLKTQREDNLSDANASGDVAVADAPGPAPSAPVWDDETETAASGVSANISPLKETSSKRRSSAAPSEGRARASPSTAKASPEQQRYRDACWALLRGPGKRQGVDLGKSGDGKEVKAMDWLYRNKVPGQKVTEMFHIMLSDPKYRTKSISLTHLVDEYPSFKHDPDAFRAEYENKAKRGVINGQYQPVQAAQAARNRTRRSDPHEGATRRACPGDDD